jgi:hypothetical protein
MISSIIITYIKSGIVIWAEYVALMMTEKWTRSVTL